MTENPQTRRQALRSIGIGTTTLTGFTAAGAAANSDNNASQEGESSQLEKVEDYSRGDNLSDGEYAVLDDTWIIGLPRLGELEITFQSDGGIEAALVVFNQTLRSAYIGPDGGWVSWNVVNLGIFDISISISYWGDDVYYYGEVCTWTFWSGKDCSDISASIPP
jgi:hypothetical protein